MNRLTSRSVALLVAAAVAVTTIAALRSARAPVVPRPEAAGGAAAGGRNAGLYERIQISMAAATSRNEQAVALCESEINAILGREFAEIAHEGDEAAEEVATYSSCCGIIYRLAKDKVFGGTNAADYVDAELGGRLRPTLHACARQLDTALARFDRSLAESTVTLAGELAQVGGSASNASLDVKVAVRPTDDLDATLRNLGFNAAAIGVGLTLDAWAILNTKLVQGLVTKAASMAASMFARPAAAAAAEMTIAVADGPLPIGDVIALVGGAWTAYDIYATRAEFERELKTTLANALPDMKRSVHDQLMTRIRGTLDAHRRVQDSIRTASTDAITR
jgi:hypothetical protein